MLPDGSKRGEWACDNLGVYNSGERHANWIRNDVFADIVVEDEQQKGVYVIQPHKVQGIIMLLTGISDMVDETYTQGII